MLDLGGDSDEDDCVTVTLPPVLPPVPELAPLAPPVNMPPPQLPPIIPLVPPVHQAPPRHTQHVL